MRVKFLIILMVSFSLFMLTACSYDEVEINSTKVFYGESETWGATLSVKQVQNNGDHTFKITQISNLTYKGDARDKGKGNSTSVQVSIEGVSPESGSSIRLQEYNTWRKSSNTSKEYGLEEDEFEVVVTWNNKEETFTLSHKKEKASELNLYNAAEVYKGLSKQQNNRVNSF
ncbi:hypothetical protein [Halobacillus sp. K22]|uniref:hypothetical protein n=1 Tax=Halobacillus sp. K22 TaxID=3457431 RepID=UPI003FCE9C11